MEEVAEWKGWIEIRWSCERLESCINIAASWLQFRYCVNVGLLESGQAYWHGVVAKNCISQVYHINGAVYQTLKAIRWIEYPIMGY